MGLHYLLKLKIRVFVKKNLMLEKQNSRHFAYCLWFFLFWKIQLFDFLTLCYGKFNQENTYETLSESELFYKRYDKNILLCIFGSRFQLLFTGKTRMLSFTRYDRHIIQMRRKTVTFLYNKFTQDNMYQILSQSVKYCRLYIKKTILVCFSVHCVFSVFYFTCNHVWN